MAGLALLERGDAPGAAARLARALEDARESGASIQDEVWRELCRAKYEAWRADAAQRAAARAALLARAEAALLRETEPTAEADAAEAMASDDDAAMAASASSPAASPLACALALVPTPPPPPSCTRGGGHAPDACALAAAAEALAASSPAERVAALRRIFAAADAADAGGAEAPQELCCPLTLDVFRDPVLAPCSGHSYERSAVLEHLAKVGEFDPMTRAPLAAKHLVRNVALRCAAAAWLDAHPAAYADLAAAAPPAE
jgi:STIP1 family protein 1